MSFRTLLRRLIRTPYASGRLLSTLISLPTFAFQWLRYRRSSQENVMMADWYPCIGDATKVTEFDPHYFYQSAWASRCIARSRVRLHVDVGSQINFIGPLAGFIQVEFIDLRPLEASFPNLVSRKGSILNLPYKDRSVQSVSCLHVIEHIGLGRYGDTIDTEGSKKACGELQRILKKGGSLYLTTPVGRERVEFNAHRIFHPATILTYVPELRLTSFASIDDEGIFTLHSDPMDCAGLNYGLGLYHFVRP